MTFEVLINAYVNKTLKNTIPKTNGIYKVKVPKNMQITFNKDNVAFGNYQPCKTTPFSVDELQQKFDKGDRKTLYIGKAKREGGLYKRIKEYIKQGLGKTGHKGGRAIFQIENWYELELEFEENSNPVLKEAELISDYFEKYKTLPVANRVKPKIIKQKP